MRNMRQVVDLLRQIGSAAGPGRLGETARRAAEGLVRGIVAPPLALDDESGADESGAAGDGPGFDREAAVEADVERDNGPIHDSGAVGS